MLKEVFFALWFFLPAGIANAVPVLAAILPGLRRFDTPMDFGLSLRGSRVFGDHKTIRGLVIGMVCSTLILLLQQYIVVRSAAIADWTSAVDYTNLPVFILGPLFGFGALLGDAIESFFKRLRGIKPGDGWFPFDQTDYIIGGALVTIPFVQLSIFRYAMLLVIWLAVHMISTVIAYHIGLKDKPI